MLYVISAHNLLINRYKIYLFLRLEGVTLKYFNI